MSTCRHCDGAKTVEVDGVETECPACNGTGEGEYYNDADASEGDPRG